MGVIEIIAAILLILACVFIIVIVLMQDSKQGMSQTITGASADNYYQKNSGRTNEAKLAKGTKIAAVAFFVITLLVNVIAIYFK
ncbi:MAG: preprotein translocase subunit SecG, partial [Ruminiclostridium sp.]